MIIRDLASGRNGLLLLCVRIGAIRAAIASYQTTDSLPFFSQGQNGRRGLGGTPRQFQSRACSAISTISRSCCLLLGKPSQTWKRGRTSLRNVNASARLCNCLDLMHTLRRPWCGQGATGFRVQWRVGRNLHGRRRARRSRPSNRTLVWIVIPCEAWAMFCLVPKNC